MDTALPHTLLCRGCQLRRGRSAFINNDRSLTSSHIAEQLITDLASIKRHILSAPFERAFDKCGQNGEVEVIKYRDLEAFYIQPMTDRVTVIVSVVFKDETDQVLAKTFLQVSYTLLVPARRYLKELLIHAARNSWMYANNRIHKMHLRCYTLPSIYLVSYKD